MNGRLVARTARGRGYAFFFFLSFLSFLCGTGQQHCAVGSLAVKWGLVGGLELGTRNGRPCPAWMCALGEDLVGPVERRRKTKKKKKRK